MTHLLAKLVDFTDGSWKHAVNGLIGAVASWSAVGLANMGNVDAGLKIAYDALMVAVGLVSLMIGVRNWRKGAKKKK